MNRDPIQSILIKETETRHDPKPYIAYRVDVQAPVRQWHVWKRYSDFSKLHDQLTQTFPDSIIPAELPHRHIFPRTISSADRIEDRRQGLEEYIRTILTSHDDRWRKTDIWVDFFALPQSSTSSSLPQVTPESWLDDYDEGWSLSKDIRSFINSRNTHQNQQNISSAMQFEVKAKKSLISLNGQITNLEKHLSLGSLVAEGEERRREDKLNALKVERDVLVRLVNATRQDLVRDNNFASVIEETKTQDQNHEGYDDIGFFSPSQQQQNKNALFVKTATKIGSGRAFGTALLEKQRKLKEQEATKGLDNEQLLQYQNKLMKEQDSQLEQFSDILGRQKEIGLSIHDELENQIDILDNLDIQVDKTTSKLGFAKKKLAKVSK